MKAYITILFSWCFTSFYVMAQPGSLNIDSHKKVLLAEGGDTNKVNTLNALSEALWR